MASHYLGTLAMLILRRLRQAGMILQRSRRLTPCQIARRCAQARLSQVGLGLGLVVRWATRLMAALAGRAGAVRPRLQWSTGASRCQGVGQYRQRAQALALVTHMAQGMVARRDKRVERSARRYRLVGTGRSAMLSRSRSLCVSPSSCIIIVVVLLELLLVFVETS